MRRIGLWEYNYSMPNYLISKWYIFQQLLWPIYVKNQHLWQLVSISAFNFSARWLPINRIVLLPSRPSTHHPTKLNKILYVFGLEPNICSRHIICWSFVQIKQSLIHCIAGMYNWLTYWETNKALQYKGWAMQPQNSRCKSIFAFFLPALDSFDSSSSAAALSSSSDFFCGDSLSARSFKRWYTTSCPWLLNPYLAMRITK